ncbi:MAG TPA: tRNA (adenosine(37)-N6)-threonylcarbamoyltransferase complex ATPase subunit type 1 TsaE [Acidimicrobiales bacterium]|nr:tRNA (adenosine(37)-N6)-threonylcarbamoyltransferase complex ATPase subunit type 1 TsaE [Acidimicrobiales bacterium]
MTAPPRPAAPGAGALEAFTTGPQDTRALGAALARLLRPGDVLLVSGDLGAGKTVLAQGLAAGLGVREQVTSPTFTLVRHLPCGPRAGDPDGPGPLRTMLHADLYRLEHLREVVELGLGELVEDAAVAVVEWGEAAAPVIGPDVLVISIASVTGGDGDGGEEGAEATRRHLRVTPAGSWAARAGALAEALAPWAGSRAAAPAASGRGGAG